MKIFTSKSQLSEYLDDLRKRNQKIGFVPTMGALHQGHISLINTAGRMSDTVVCSIFVNPTQFNDPNDLEKYPRPLEADIKKLEDANCSVLFLPSVEEMYADNKPWHLNLGYLEEILEGKFRPGHYQGVTQIVKKLFDVVKPDKAFFGQKDFQQVKIIEAMVKMLDIPVEIIMCPITREDDGLAMSSRNIHLSRSERKQALALWNALNYTLDHFSVKQLSELKEEAAGLLISSEGVRLEYFEICDAGSLKATDNKEIPGIVALVAAYVGNTRLIDNIILK